MAGQTAAAARPDFRHMEMTRLIGELFTQQGASERIKNFPYPRQYATMNLWFVKIFVVLVPLGMLQEFEKPGGPLIWLGIPFSALAGWIFTTMEKIGEGTENPSRITIVFQGIDHPASHRRLRMLRQAVDQGADQAASPCVGRAVSANV